MNNMFTIRISAYTNRIKALLSQELPEGVAVISIMERQFLPSIDYPQARLLRLRFSDASDPDATGHMTDEQALAVRDFVHAWQKHIDALIVHCSAGISRSPAIAAAIMRAYGKSDLPIWKNPDYSPNTLCYCKMLEAYGIRFSFLKYREWVNERAFRRMYKHLR